MIPIIGLFGRIYRVSETEKKKTWYVIMCNINSVVTVLYYILSNVQQTKNIFFSDRNFVTVLILILRKSNAYLHNHECESNAVPIAYFMNPKRTLPPMTHSQVSPFLTL